MIKINNDSVLPICAVRYAIGRETYMPDMVIREIRPMLSELSDRNLDVMARDILEELVRYQRMGHELPQGDQWQQFYEDIIKEQVRRVHG